jgi:guanine deaminase
VVYFGTIHLEGTKVLVEKVEELGQRAFIGKVNMDR